jgi:ribosomal protein S12 methylthiotransferase accessory factor YcaO
MTEEIERQETAYRLEKVGTGAGTGWFSCVPEGETPLERGLDHLAARPMDRFMHRHLLSRVASLEAGEVRGLLEHGDPHVRALACEACLETEGLQGLLEGIDRGLPAGLTSHTPDIRIRWWLERASESRLYWVRAFSRNVLLHEPLPPPGEAEHEVLVDREAVDAWARGVVPLRRMGFLEGGGRPEPSAPGPSRRDVRALQERLEGLGLLEGWETRTEATLSPYAVERPWHLEIRTRNGRNRWRLRGAQTGYGRGLDVHRARISCLMEIVERCSAFASFEPDRVPGARAGLRLRRGGADELEAQGLRVLDLHRMRLEVPYQGDVLSWVAGEEAAETGPRKVWVPAQLAFLFANLDEAGLTSGISSNGLGAGATQAQARLSGLLEVIERDAERVVPFSPERCFSLEAGDPRVSEMLRDLEGKGVHVRFVDLTPELGVPCYQAFVEAPGGIVLKGCGAHLDGRRAAVSAMTEIPWPYPYWFGTAPPPEGTRRVRLEELPCWSTGKEAGDLERLESLLHANGYAPVYVDLTREDLGLPVCRALVPGLELMTLFDRYTPLGVRQFGHYLSLFSSGRIAP